MRKSGIPLRWVNYALVALTALLAVLLMHAVAQTTARYDEMRSSTERYFRAQADADDMQRGSDCLTQEARAFAVTGDLTHVEAFFREAEETRRRDRAVADIRELAESPESLAHMEQAMAFSQELMQREYLSMRLRLATLGEAPAFPALAAVELTEEQAALSPAEQTALAQDLVFDAAYQELKERINREVRLCTEALIGQTRAAQEAASGQLLATLRRQQMLIVVMGLAVVATVLGAAFLMIRPLARNAALVKQDQPMRSEGAREVRELAESYNEMYARTIRSQEKLSWEATHDPLTGILNRKAYEQTLAGSDEHTMALIWVDVDDFKGVNDTYGHDVGDLVLQRVARVLTESFRSEDAVCRTGGDEFAVLMMRVHSGLEELVVEKVCRIRQRLAEPEGRTPGLTLSVGIAFGDRPGPSGTIFQDADRALYYVKAKGRNGYAVYRPDMPPAGRVPRRRA